MHKDTLSANLEEFFKHRDFVAVIDQLAQRYGKLPHEVLAEHSVYDFSFDIAVMVIASLEQKKTRAQTMTPWNRFGINRIIRKKA